MSYNGVDNKLFSRMVFVNPSAQGCRLADNTLSRSSYEHKHLLNAHFQFPRKVSNKKS